MRFTFVNASFKKFAAVQPPLGLAYLAAVLKRKSTAITVIDANAERLTIEQTVKRILESEPDILGFTMTTPLVDVSLQIVEQVKSKKDVPIIVGGPHPTVMPEELLEGNKIDIVVRGEGEETINELYDYFRGTRRLDSIPGISFSRNGKIIHNPSRPLIENLDEIPFPAWEFFPVNKYSSFARKGKFSLPILTSRGCPFGCIFCYKGISGRRYRARSVESIIAELGYLIEKFKIEEFVIVDDNSALNEERAMTICDEIIRRNLVRPWNPVGGLTVRASYKLLSKMKEAGCYRVAFGVESGNQSVLDYINKGITLEQARHAFASAKKVGLEAVGFFMIGNLNETEKTINQTIDFAIELNPDWAQFTVATPYPGTKMYEIIKKEGKLLAKNWEDFASYDRAIFSYRELTPFFLDKKYREAYRRFYLRPQVIVKKIRKVTSFFELKNLFKGIKGFLQLVKPKLGR